MASLIRKMEQKDGACVREMMQVFYASPAVHTNGSEQIFSIDIENCVNDNPYLEGYVVENDGEIQGYAMLAKSFSTEFGKFCIWIEDIYIKEEFRGLGLGQKIMEFIINEYPGHLIRLEVEAENQRALTLYKKCGFDLLPYLEMKR